jgi:flagellar hook-associated protein 3 FlgL
VRVTEAMLHRTALNDVTRARERLARTQEQAASGLVINRPSDDPVGAGLAVTLEATLAALAQQARTVSGARARVTAGEGAIADAQQLLVRARELALQGANATQSASTRAQIASEVAGLHATLLASANARYDGGYVFAGFASDAAPFVASGPFSSPPPAAPTVSYLGDGSEIQVEIEAGVQVSMNADGRRAFLGDGDGNGLPDSGREDVFEVLGDLWEALSSNDPAATAAVLPRIDRALDQLSVERTGFGVTGGRLEAAEQRLAQRSLDAEARLSQLRDADMAEVVSKLVQQESALEAGLSGMAQLLQQSLLDFLS